MTEMATTIKSGRMKKNAKIILCAVITLICFLAFIPNCYATHTDYTAENLEDTINGCIKWKKSQTGISENQDLLAQSTQENSWYAVCESALGIDDDFESYEKSLESYVCDMYASQGGLDEIKATEWHRMIIAISACGGDATNVDGINLVADGIYNRGKTAPLDSQGLNGSIWALIALDSKNYEIPENAFSTREDIINSIVSYQNDDGSFSLDGNGADADITAMAVQALYSYNDMTDFSAEKGLEYLSALQNDDGSFSSDKEPCCETTVQTILALCAAQKGPTYFMKNGCDALDGLMKFCNDDGGFSHLYGGQSDAMATMQALQALTAVCRLYAGESGVFSVDCTTENLFESGKIIPFVMLGEGDKALFDEISKSCTTEYQTQTEYLINRINNAKNADEFSDMKKSLEKKQAEINAITEQINSLNKEIYDSIYPIKSTGFTDYSRLADIKKQADKLSAYDKSKVLAYDEICNKIQRLDRMRNVLLIAGILLLAVVICIVVVKRQQKHKRGNKNGE